MFTITCFVEFSDKTSQLSFDVSVHKFLTFFTIPSPYYATRYKHKLHLYAVNSWTRFPDVKVVIFTSELNETIKKQYPSNVKLIDKPLETGYNGNPLIRDWFLTGVQMATTEYVAFINSDIVIPDRWYETTKTIVRKFKNNTYLGIARLDIQVENESFFETPYSELEERFMKMPDLYKSKGGDIFLFAKEQNKFNISKMPDYVIGFCKWDNYMYDQMGKFDYSISYQRNPPVFHFPHGRNKCSRPSFRAFRLAAQKVGYKQTACSHQCMKWRLNIKKGFIFNKFNKTERVQIFDK